MKYYRIQTLLQQTIETLPRKKNGKINIIREINCIIFSKGGGGLICAHAPILFLLCMVNAFILTPTKMHVFVLKNIFRSQNSTLTYSTFVTILCLYVISY